MTEFGAVIVAAGLSSRMGDFKPMLPLGNSTVIRHVIQTFHQAGIDRIIVVTGYRSEELEEHIKDCNVEVVRNERYAQSQMFDSVKLGFSTIHHACRKVFFTPADTPLFNVHILKKLMDSHSNLICPAWEGKNGHPVLIADHMLARILTYDGTGGLRGAFQNCGMKMEKIPVKDCGVIYDMDTQKDYARILELYSSFPQLKE